MDNASHLFLHKDSERLGAMLAEAKAEYEAERRRNLTVAEIEREETYKRIQKERVEKVLALIKSGATASQRQRIVDFREVERLFGQVVNDAGLEVHRGRLRRKPNAGAKNRGGRSHVRHLSRITKHVYSTTRLC